MPDSGAGLETLAIASTDRPTRPAAWRFVLAVGCMVAAFVAAWTATPQAHLLDDPELARLLRGMALIKGAIVLAGIAVLTWRFGRAVPTPIAASYLIGTWVAAGASVTIWQLASVPIAAIAFHLGEFAVLVAAWRDMPARNRHARQETSTPR